MPVIGIVSASHGIHGSLASQFGSGGQSPMA
ncbi:hypothetical protein M529_07275 [Sphingobium ummariense RL-3]|uniref:Uncharacterized protein n=1 Tax=Sphingobium ummariense RL-3 TaxID=1346791 RepID=T0J4F3_9SPHN|nr:hypothetical protein M529_07275 [Sphingobium ummariense RL-3]